MSEVVDIIIDPFTRQKVRAEIPPSSTIAPEAARRDLGLGDFVDVGDPEIARAVVLLNALRIGGSPRLALFGGAAHRLICPSANDPATGLRRALHDLDLACLHREVKEVTTFLKEAGGRYGSRVLFFEMPGDRTFNTLSGGRRYRFHDLGSSQGDDIDLGTIDLVADQFQFCHSFSFAEDLSVAREGSVTLPPALLLLAKLQFIRRIPATDASQVPERVLEPFGRREVVIGPEARDVKDILSLLHDLEFGEGPHDISLDRVRRLLSDDWGFWTTVRLNLGMVERSPTLSGLPTSLRERVRPKLVTLREVVDSLSPKRRLAFLRNQWWEEVDEVTSTETAARASETFSPGSRGGS